MTPAAWQTRTHPAAVVDAASLTAVADLAYAACGLGHSPEVRAGCLLAGLARLLRADGAAAYHAPWPWRDGRPQATPFRGHRWTGADAAQLVVGLAGRDDPRGGTWFEGAARIAGCKRVSVVGRHGRVYYLCSNPPGGQRHGVILVLKRGDRLGPFGAAEAGVLRAFHRSSLAGLLARRCPAPAGGTAGSGLAPRMVATLAGLKEGLSEKEIAAALQISHHTVHVYVKRIYQHYGVSSRAELLSRWIGGPGGSPEPEGASP